MLLNPLQLKPFLSLPFFLAYLTPYPHPLSPSPVPLSLHSQEGRETDLGLSCCNLFLCDKPS